MTKVTDFKAIKLKLASPGDILDWSYGEVIKPETINYRTQKPEKDGLFSEAIFGPVSDYKCYCGKYTRIRYKGIICDKCGVEVTRSIVRRERMGHIKLATPVAHIWFLRSVPSRIGLILDLPISELEKVIYFASYIVTKVNEEARVEALKNIDREWKSKIKGITDKGQIAKFEELRAQEKDKIKNLQKMDILSELEYRDLSLKYAEVFEAGIGAQAIKKILEGINLQDLAFQIEQDIDEATPLNRRNLIKRLKLVKGMLKSGVRPEHMFLEVLPTIPPDLRPMVQLDGGRFATSDLNDLYRRVINRNNRLKHLLELNAPEVITRNEKRMLQEAVDALIDNSARRGQTSVTASTGQKRPLKSLADILKGKQGRFRQNLLGKRVDYSGRSVIVIGPELKMDECGLAKRMALELFKPFVMRVLIERGLSHNIRGATRLIEKETEEVWQILEEVIGDKLVLLNRAPTLHRLSIQAFKPKLIEGSAIEIPSMCCRAFNADFDGDQMAVHLPLTDEAQNEAKNLMWARLNFLKPATGEPITNPTKDITLGCFYLTNIWSGAKGSGKIFDGAQDALLAYEFDQIALRAKIKIKRSNFKNIRGQIGDPADKFLETSVGRVIFNQALPEVLQFINDDMTQKKLKVLVAESLDLAGGRATAEFLDKIKDLGFRYATISGISLGIDDLVVPNVKKQLLEETEKLIEGNRALYEKGLMTEEERKTRAIEIWTGIRSKISAAVKKELAENDPVYLMVESGARGTWFIVDQLMGMKGLVVNPRGEIIELPVKNSFKEGFNVLEYFISSHGARKGLADTALRTATAGYLTRRLVDVSQDVVIREDDCRDSQGIEFFKDESAAIGESLGVRIKGRVSLESIKDNKEGKLIVKANEVINKFAADQIDKLGLEKIKIRSLLTCKTRHGVCSKCYGYDLARNELIKIGEAAGIVTAQAIGEPGTQLTMRTFHTGGVAGGGDITIGLPRVEEIFEARPPKSKAVIADVSGKVLEIREAGSNKIVVVETKQLIEEDGKKIEKNVLREYAVGARNALWVKAGDLVDPGTQLAEGGIDLKEFFSIVKDIVKVARYMTREVRAIYASEGEGVNDKHVELIIRQMFSRVRIRDAGDTILLPGDVVEKDVVFDANAEVKKTGGRQSTFEQLLLGITRVSLTTESFLSAASFQETARVLIDASLFGKSDKLRGLKENVIIGRLIPAGSGYRAYEE